MTLTTDTTPGAFVLSAMVGGASYVGALLWGAAIQAPWWVPIAIASIGASVPLTGHAVSVYRAVKDRRLQRAQHRAASLAMELERERREHSATRERLAGREKGGEGQ